MKTPQLQYIIQESIEKFNTVKQFGHCLELSGSLYLLKCYFLTP